MLVFTSNLLTCCAVSLLLAPAIAVLWGTEKLHLVNYLACNYFARVSRLTLGLRVTVENEEILDQHEGPVILLNHQCILDLVPMYV